MDLRNTVRAASEAGLVAVTEGVATFREALPEQTRIHAERAVAGTSPVRKGVVALVEAAADRAEESGRRAAARMEAARVDLRQRAQEVEQAAASAVAAKVPAMKEEAMEESRSAGAFWKLALAVVGIGAAAGAGYALYTRRRAAERRRAQEQGESFAAPAPAFVPGMADTQSPDVVDEHFAEEVDAVAEELAEDLVEAVEGPLDHGDEPAPAEHFEPGMADTESPDVEDEEFARQVDAVADEFAKDIVEAVEEPKS